MNDKDNQQNIKEIKQNKKYNSYNIALLGLFSAFAIILGYVEFLIPINIPIYGFKLGFSNIATLLALYIFGFRYAMIISIIRIVIINLLFGTFFSLAFSLSGGIVSLIAMFIVYRFFKGTMMFVSSIGGLIHNVVQLFVAALLLGSKDILYLISILVVIGILTGLFVGFVSSIINKRIAKYIKSLKKVGQFR